MTEKGFIPLSSQLGIPGISYRIQLGMINDKWVSRLLKGNDVIDSYIYKDKDVGEQGFPNQNKIVDRVLRTIANQNINPHQIRYLLDNILKRFNAQNELNPDMVHELGNALTKLELLMKQDNSKEVVIDRKYLPEIFNPSLIEILISDGLPVLKPFVLEFFLVNGILSKIEGQSIVFRKVTIP